MNYLAPLAGAVDEEDPPPNECPGYDTTQSKGEISVMLNL